MTTSAQRAAAVKTYTYINVCFYHLCICHILIKTFQSVNLHTKCKKNLTLSQAMLMYSHIP